MGRLDQCEYDCAACGARVYVIGAKMPLETMCSRCRTERMGARARADNGTGRPTVYPAAPDAPAPPDSKLNVN